MVKRLVLCGRSWQPRGPGSKSREAFLILFFLYKNPKALMCALVLATCAVYNHTSAWDVTLLLKNHCFVWWLCALHVLSEYIIYFGGWKNCWIVQFLCPWEDTLLVCIFFGVWLRKCSWINWDFSRFLNGHSICDILIILLGNCIGIFFCIN